MPDGRWVSTHDDITVQQNSEKALRDQKMQLDAALNNMSQGLCMFDGDARLILCNHRYLQMSGLSVSDLQPGITLVELLEKRRAKGTWSSDPRKYTEELRATLAKGETFTITVEGPGGRTISIYNRPLPDGQWVSCHEDITERCKAEQQTQRTKAPARRGDPEHVARAVHVRCRRPGRAVQSALRRDDEHLARIPEPTARSPT